MTTPTSAADKIVELEGKLITLKLAALNVHAAFAKDAVPGTKAQAEALANLHSVACK